MKTWTPPPIGKWMLCDACGHHADVHGRSEPGWDPCACCEPFVDRLEVQQRDGGR